MSSLSKYYKKAVLIPLIVTLIVGLVLAIFHDGSDYKSEWSTDDGFGLTVFLIIAFSFLIAFFSLTIFLANVDQVFNSFFFSLLSWTLLPLGFIGYVFSKIISEWKMFREEQNLILDGYILFVCLLHSVFLIIQFIQFRNNTKSRGSKMLK
jgi:hypothetical protein